MRLHFTNIYIGSISKEKKFEGNKNIGQCAAIYLKACSALIKTSAHNELG